MIASLVMTPNPTTLSVTARVEDAITLFRSTSLHDIPVVDQDGKPVGSISCKAILHASVPKYASDSLLATMEGGPDIASVYSNLHNLSEKPVSEIMDQSIHSVKGTTPTSAIAAMLTHMHYDSFNILVVDEPGKLIGTISAFDIVCRSRDHPL
ncbi:MAG: CBS domain-containing protein [Mariprofundaceae bacterium]